MEPPSGMRELRYGRCRVAGCAWLAFLAAGGVPAAFGGEGWMRFRGPNGSGVSEDRGLPLQWTATRNVVWKTELPGPGTSSPIVVGGRVYLTCFSGYGVPGRPGGSMNLLKRSLVCLGRKDGAIRWTRDLKVRLPEQARTREDHGYASSTPACDGERLYVFCGKSGVFAFDLEGRQLWHADVGSGLSGWGSAASPVVFGDLAIVNASVESASLIALDKQSGKRVWQAEGVKEAWNTPLLVPVGGGRTELVVAVPRKVIGFDPASGKQLWTCSTDITWYMVPSMVCHEGVVFCIGGRSGQAGALAIRAGGRGDVTGTHRLWRTGKWSNVSSPVYHDGHLYFAQEQRGVACCLDAKTGKVIYEEPLEPRSGQVYASGVLADGKLYYVSRRGGAYVLPAKPAFKVLAHNSLGDRSAFNASPAVSESQLLIRSDARLYCLGEK